MKQLCDEPSIVTCAGFDRTVTKARAICAGEGSGSKARCCWCAIEDVESSQNSEALSHCFRSVLEAPLSAMRLVIVCWEVRPEGARCAEVGSRSFPRCI